MSLPYTIRPATRAELEIPIAWAASEGWNPGLHDGDSFYATDPEGFLLGFLGDEPIASISVVKYGRSFGFLGFYIVKSTYRGKGYGIQIWRAGMAALQGRNVGLDGVTAQQENYKKSGFALAYANIRYEGISSGDAPKDDNIISLKNVPFDDLLAYDKLFFPDERSRFLQSWIHQPESVALGLISKSRLMGYGVLRPCVTGYKIGPLFADSPATAERLFSALSGLAPQGTSIYLDAPAVNPAAVALAEKHNMRAVFETARMYTKENPALPLDRLFGVTTFELG